MLELFFSSQFKRDFKRVMKRNKNREKLKQLVDKLARGEMLAIRHCDHQLTGKYSKHRECHIEPDWLLIYKIIDHTLYLERTGSHSDLF